MTSILDRGAKAVVLAIAVLALGCETGTEPPSPPLQQVDGPESSLLGGLFGGGGLLGGDGLLGSTLSIANRTIALLADEVLRKKIDPDVGGELKLLGNSLRVNPGAVDRPTMFVMAVLAGPEIQVELTAYDPELYDDVGGKGFNVPVTLALSYADAGPDFDPSTAKIVHIKENGDRVEIPSRVDRTNKVVRARLSHFSRYALCSN